MKQIGIPPHNGSESGSCYTDNPQIPCKNVDTKNEQVGRMFVKAAECAGKAVVETIAVKPFLPNQITVPVVVGAATVAGVGCLAKEAMDHACASAEEGFPKVACDLANNVVEQTHGYVSRKITD